MNYLLCIYRVIQWEKKINMDLSLFLCLVWFFGSSTNTGNDLMTWSSLVGEQKLLLKVTQCDNNMLAGKGAGNNA